MRITITFACVVATILVAGAAYQRWDRSRRLRFGDEAGSTAATLALARVEGRELMRHPTWLITIALITVVTVALTIAEGGSETDAWSLPWFSFIGVPVAGLALVVSAHRITTRSRRHGTDELEASTPTAPRARTRSLLLACLAPLLLIAVYVVAVLVLVYSIYDYAPAPSIDVFVPLLTFTVLPVVGGAVVGVFLGRWLPFAAAALGGIVALIWLNNGVEHLHPRYRMLRPLVETHYGGPFDITPYGWHLTFVASVVGLGACLAMWHHGASRRLGTATVAVVAVMVGTGWVVTRPPSAEAVADVVDRLERPAEHLPCQERRSVTYCVHPGAEEWIEAWAPAVDGVLSQVPAAARPSDLRLVQRLVVGPHELLPEVHAALDPAVAWAADGDLHPNYFMNEPGRELAVAWQAAAVAVGLPPATSWDWPVGCMAGGQARTVLAHVLAARATAGTRRSFDDHSKWVVEEAREHTAVPIDIERDYDAEMQRTPDELRLGADGRTLRTHVPFAGASGWGTDVLAAKAMIGLDDGSLDAVIGSNWVELVDPATPAARFLELTGVDGAPTAPAPTRLDDTRACA